MSRYDSPFSFYEDFYESPCAERIEDLRFVAEGSFEIWSETPTVGNPFAFPTFGVASRIVNPLGFGSSNVPPTGNPPLEGNPEWDYTEHRVIIKGFLETSVGNVNLTRGPGGSGHVSIFGVGHPQWTPPETQDRSLRMLFQWNIKLDPPDALGNTNQTVFTIVNDGGDGPVVFIHKFLTFRSYRTVFGIKLAQAPATLGPRIGRVSRDAQNLPPYPYEFDCGRFSAEDQSGPWFYLKGGTQPNIAVSGPQVQQALRSKWFRPRYVEDYRDPQIIDFLPR